MAKSPKAKSSGGSAPSDLVRLKEILELLKQYDIAELEWERPGGDRLSLRTQAAFSGSNGGMPAVHHAPMMMTHSSPLAPAPSHAHAPASKPHAAPEAKDAHAAQGAPKASAANPAHKQVDSPFVGTFYRAPSPEAEPYAREGQVIKRGDVLCIIEAMKLMNEIEAEFGGKIVSILVENGQPVEFGEPLFVVDTSAG